MSSSRDRSSGPKQNTLFDGRPPFALAAIVLPNRTTMTVPGAVGPVETTGSGATSRSMRRASSGESSGTSRLTTRSMITALGTTCASQQRRHRRRRLGRREDRNALEIDEVAPLRHPLLEERGIVALHDLIAMADVRRDPARDILQAVGRETAPVAKSPVDGACIPVAKVFHDHVAHGIRSPSRGPAQPYRNSARTRSVYCRLLRSCTPPLISITCPPDSCVRTVRMRSTATIADR